MPHSGSNTDARKAMEPSADIGQGWSHETSSVRAGVAADGHGTRVEPDVVRFARSFEISALATLWHDVLTETYPDFLPDLVNLMDVDELAERLERMLQDLLVIGPVGAPIGFCALKRDEVSQFFLLPSAWGTGRAGQLLDCAEDLLLARGGKMAWLACVVGNTRARRFYERHGWQIVRTEDHVIDALRGRVKMTVWRLEKSLGAQESA